MAIPNMSLQRTHIIASIVLHSLCYGHLFSGGSFEKATVKHQIGPDYIFQSYKERTTGYSDMI